MLEALLLVTTMGLALASDRRLGFGNPYQIYFLIWLPILAAYYLLRDVFVVVPADYLVLMLVAKALALLMLLMARSGLSDRTGANQYPSFVFRTHLIAVAQLSVCLAAPLAYLRAKEIAGGDDIFTVVGYIALRSAMTEDGVPIGFLTYFSVLSYAVTALTAVVYKEESTTLLRLVISVAVSLFYAYLSTGRTNFLLLLLMVLMPLILLGIVRIKGLIIAFLLIGVTFVLVAAMTAKGVSLEASFSENTASLMENLTAYTAAPFVAMSKLVQVDRPADWGANTSRFFMSALYALGAIESPPSSLIRDYVFVPNPTNVYTVYDVYFRDFSYFGLFIPPLFLAFHWWLYRQARVAAGRWVFYYAASVYPLVMQFFQDQYFSLLSIWIQLGFWFWVFVAPGKIVRAEFRPHHA